MGELRAGGLIDLDHHQVAAAAHPAGAVGVLLGLALAGHKDRNRMGTFICGVHPEGPAAMDGRLQAGDELLKVE